MLPPPPTVLRSAVSTVDVGTFRDHLSSWRDPSFLAPLSHQIDPGGPAGLIIGLASPEPRSYYHDHPLPLAVRRPAPVQRSAIARSSSALTSAPGMDRAPRHLPAEPAGVLVGKPAAVPAGPAADNPGNIENSEPPVTGPDQPGEAPLISHREAGPVTAQRQQAPDPPQPPPKRRLGLGAPLNNPAAGSPTAGRAVPRPPLVARSITTPPELASRTPPYRLVRPEPASSSAGPTERTPPIAVPVSVQPAPADPVRPPGVRPPALPPAWPVPAEPALPGPAAAGSAAAGSVSAEPAAAGSASPADAPAWAAPPADASAHAEPPAEDAPPSAGVMSSLAEDAPPTAEAPLIGALPPITHPSNPPFTQRTAASLPGSPRPPATRAATQSSALPEQGPASAAWRTVQRSLPGVEASSRNRQARPSEPGLAARSAASSDVPSVRAARPIATPGPGPAPVTPDPGPAGPFAGPAGSRSPRSDCSPTWPSRRSFLPAPRSSRCSATARRPAFWMSRPRPACGPPRPRWPRRPPTAPRSSGRFKPSYRSGRPADGPVPPSAGRRRATRSPPRSLTRARSPWPGAWPGEIRTVPWSSTCIPGLSHPAPFRRKPCNGRTRPSRHPAVSPRPRPHRPRPRRPRLRRCPLGMPRHRPAHRSTSWPASCSAR